MRETLPLLLILLQPEPTSSQNSIECLPEVVSGYVRDRCLTTTDMVIYNCSDIPGGGLYGARYGGENGEDCFFQSEPCRGGHYHYCGCQGVELVGGKCEVKYGLYCVHSQLAKHPGRLSWVGPSQFCDGVAQCKDGSDEINCKGGIMCTLTVSNGFNNDFGWLPDRFICDNIQHCRDNSDEEDCGDECAVLVSEWTGHLKVIPEEDKCQILNHDFMTEYIRKNCTGDSIVGSTCTWNNITISIPEFLRCNGCYECDDGSDEVGCVSEGFSLTGDTEKECVRDNPTKGYPTSTHNPVMCPPSLRCPSVNSDYIKLSRGSVCDGILDGRCLHDYDEKLCQTTCLIPQGHLDSSNHHHYRHIHKHQVCDGFEDCNDGKDERNCDKVVKCNRTFVEAGRGPQTIPERWLCDGVKDCVDGSDENKSKWKVCGDGAGCYTRRSHCDGIPDCRDGSDELKCGQNPGFKCSHGEPRIISPDLLCNGQRDCLSGVDEKYCGIIKDQGTWGEVKDSKDVCNSRKFRPNATHGERDTIECLTFQKYFLSKDLETDHVDYKFYKRVDCTLKYGADYVMHACLGLCAQEKANNCPIRAPEELKCSNDDVVSTLKRADQTLRSFTRTTPIDSYEGQVYQCRTTRKCIPIEQVCDLMNDCGDNEDEMGCVNHFPCGGDQPPRLIRRDQVCDGVRDCADLSDEVNISCPQISALTTEQHIFGGMTWLNGSTTARIFTALGVTGVFVNLATLLLLSYQFAVDPFKYGSKTICIMFLKIVCIAEVGLSFYLLLLGWQNPHYSSNSPKHSFIYLQQAWLQSDECEKLGVLSSGSILVILASFVVINYISASHLCTGKKTMTNSKSLYNCSKTSTLSVFLGITMVMLIFGYTYIPRLATSRDAFVKNVKYDIFPINNASKKNIMELIEYYYEGTRTPTTWFEINIAIQDMFNKIHRVVNVEYRHYYGGNEICFFPLLGKSEDTQVSSLYKKFTLIIMCMVMVANICLTAFSFLYRALRPIIHQPKTDFPTGTVQIIGIPTILTYLPIIILSSLNSIGIIGIRYYYTVIAILTVVSSVLNNIFIIGISSKAIIKKHTDRVTLSRYPSIEEVTLEDLGKNNIARIDPKNKI